jgi:hypothetical protein
MSCWGGNNTAIVPAYPAIAGLWPDDDYFEASSLYVLNAYIQARGL